MRKVLSLVLVLAIAFGAFGVAFAQEDGPIRVGSKQFTEQLVLGQLMLVALEANGFEVEDRTNLGGTAVNREALLAGEIDVYAEYTGTAITNYFREVEYIDVDELVTFSGDAYASYGIVSALDAAIFDMIWLQPAPANNTYAFAVMSDFAEENNLYTAQDLADFVNAGNEVVVSTGDEFAQRPDGIPAFEATYDFAFPEDSLIIIAGGTPAQSLQALNAGENGVNVGMTYGTTGELLGYDMVVLEDPDGAQPVYAPTPVFRGEVIRANPEIAAILNPIFAMLDNDTLQELNARVGLDGEDPAAVARDFLVSNGLIDG